MSENTHLLRKGKYHCTADLLFCLFGLSCFACLLNKQQLYLFDLIQTSQTGGQPYSHTSPVCIRRLTGAISGLIFEPSTLQPTLETYARQFTSPYSTTILVYDRRVFIRLTTGAHKWWMSSYVKLLILPP